MEFGQHSPVQWIVSTAIEWTFGLFDTNMNIEHAHKSLILINGHNIGCDVSQRININDIYFRTLPLQTQIHMHINI